MVDPSLGRVQKFILTIYSFIMLKMNMFNVTLHVGRRLAPIPIARSENVVVVVGIN